jgi:hypothetical protein
VTRDALPALEAFSASDDLAVASNAHFAASDFGSHGRNSSAEPLRAMMASGGAPPGAECLHRCRARLAQHVGGVGDEINAGARAKNAITICPVFPHFLAGRLTPGRRLR